MSEIRTYLEEKLVLGEGEWLRREPRTTHPAILALIRAFHAAGGSYNEDAERYIEEAAGDLPEHFHHGHDDRDPLTYQLAHEVYIAKGILVDEESQARLDAILAEGFVPAETIAVEDGKRYTVYRGTLYVGHSVKKYGAPLEGRAVAVGESFALLPGRNRTRGFTIYHDDLIREVSA